MNYLKNIFYNTLSLYLVAVVAICGACDNTAKSQQATAVTPGSASTQTLSVDDVSILFPAPTTAADFDKIIAVDSLSIPNAQNATKRDPVWPTAIFQQFVAIADGPSGQVAAGPAPISPRISLPPEAQSSSAWFVAGIRIDAGAPGLTNDIQNQYGRLPQIRLIIQPIVRASDGTPKVLDIAGHLIFDFVTATATAPAQTECFPRQAPDDAAFQSVVTDLTALRNKLRDGQIAAKKVNTAGVPLGVHPGLAEPATATAFRNEIISFLERHISSQRLGGMAIAALPSGAPEPWIFLSMLHIPGGVVPALPQGGFVPLHGPTLDGDHQFPEMFLAAGADPRVVPTPHTNNLNPISCKNAAVTVTSLPVANRNGVATAELFSPSPTPERAKQVLDTISDPTKSHFFNTDCVSCHTETRRAMDLQGVTTIPGIDPAALPKGQWNIRNFGWSPSSKGAQATVTRRTANETATVVAFLNAQPPAKP